mmetsp:Transcript_11650/g.22096  ORF Transcript_11650/g.22096 Transcript_11650/m.22096 type:complete len:399 (+) Transcript_11650:275-1471(+)
MGKHDFLSPKAIGNRIKAKGLQKLRWYCQMCNKQCRDENGFKCHQMSDSHQRQMTVFGHNPDRVIDGYSEMFLESFVNHLKTAHRHARIAAHVVYNEYINDKHHTHMNSTKWTSLTEFVQHLGKEGICKVEDTPKGWFITLHVNNPFENIAKEKLLKRDRAEQDEEEREARALEEQVQRAHKHAKVELVEHTELKREEGDEKLAFGLNPMTLKGKATSEVGGNGARGLVAEAFSSDPGLSHSAAASKSASKKSVGNAMAEIMKEEKRREEAKLKKLERDSRTDYWLAEGIVVKVMSKALTEHGHYKKKGVVRKVVDRYIAHVKMLETGTKVQVDQAELETVIPNIGGSVMILNGVHRGAKAKVLSVDVGAFCTRVHIEEAPYKGKEVELPYEDISKLA